MDVNLFNKVKMTLISFFKKLVLLVVVNNTLPCIHFTLCTFCDEYKIYCSSSIWLNILLHRKREVLLTQLTCCLIQVYTKDIK